MSSNSSNAAVAVQPSSERNSVGGTKATTPISEAPPRALPYRPAQQLELLNLHAELDALLYQLSVATNKSSKTLLHR